MFTRNLNGNEDPTAIYNVEVTDDGQIWLRGQPNIDELRTATFKILQKAISCSNTIIMLDACILVL